MAEHKGSRYNTGKTRFSLMAPEALETIAQVYTKGAHKYSIYKDQDGNEIKGSDIPFSEIAERRLTIIYDGANNWRNGLGWSGALESVERHIQAWKRGEDIDPEMGTLHLGNAAWGLMSLLTYYEIYPEGDDRNTWYKKPFKQLWLDIDGILADYESHFLKTCGLPIDHPTDWNDFRFRDHWKDIENSEEFWKTIPRIVNPATMDYPTAGYITSRPCTNKLTASWLERMGYSKAPIENAYPDKKKSAILKEKPGNIVTVDDSIHNFVDYQSNGIVCYLMSRPHNMKYDVGHWRVTNYKELMNKLKQ